MERINFNGKWWMQRQGDFAYLMFQTRTVAKISAPEGRMNAKAWNALRTFGVDNTRVSSDADKARIADLEEALREVSSCIFNDNGDVTVNALKIERVVNAALAEGSSR